MGVVHYKQPNVHGAQVFPDSKYPIIRIILFKNCFYHQDNLSNIFRLMLNSDSCQHKLNIL